MVGWFSRRSGSRVSIRNPVRLRVLFGHQVSRETLCPLGQPEKAIGEKSPIEPWLALHNHSACCVRNRRASFREHHESAGKETPQSLVPLRGLDDQTIFPGSYRREEVFVLTSLFIERDYRNVGNRPCEDQKPVSSKATSRDLAIRISHSRVGSSTCTCGQLCLSQL